MREHTLRDEDFYGADEAFLTGTTRGVLPITAVDDRTIATGKPGPGHAEAAGGVSTRGKRNLTLRCGRAFMARPRTVKVRAASDVSCPASAGPT
jgi:hypothetical protein